MERCRSGYPNPHRREIRIRKVAVFPYPASVADSHARQRYTLPPCAHRKFSASFVAILVALLAISVRAQPAVCGPPTSASKTPVVRKSTCQRFGSCPPPICLPKLETDNAGQLALDLKPGSYALFVTAQGFVNFRQRIEIWLLSVTASLAAISTSNAQNRTWWQRSGCRQS